MAEFNSNIRIDPNKFSIQDTEDLLTATGKESIQEVFALLGGDDKKEAPVTKEVLNVIAQLIFISQRGANPDFSLEDAKRVSIGDFKAAMRQPATIEEDPETGKERLALPDR